MSWRIRLTGLVAREVEKRYRILVGKQKERTH
jgi:hypothetical protein